jgi:hypothetical protein
MRTVPSRWRSNGCLRKTGRHGYGEDGKGGDHPETKGSAEGKRLSVSMRHIETPIV